MPGKVNIGGTAYTVAYGKTKISGTTYDIGMGKTKIGGTAKDISFGTVPYKYQQVQYIKAKYNNTSCPSIQLPITTQEGLKIEFECQAVNASGRTTSFTLGSSASNDRWQYFEIYREATAIYRWGGRMYMGNQYTVTDIGVFEGVAPKVDTTNLVVCVADFGNYGTSNTATLTTGSDSSSFTRTSAISFSGNPMFLFSQSAGRGNPGVCGRVTAYNASGIIIMDLYPVYRKSDNVVGMWDSVSRQFLTKSSSDQDDFFAGPDV